jgi:hypothetical protein
MILTTDEKIMAAVLAIFAVLLVVFRLKGWMGFDAY